MIHLNELFKVSDDHFLLHKTSLDLMPGELLAIRCQEHQSSLWMDLLTGKTLPTGGDLLINNRVPMPQSPDVDIYADGQLRPIDTSEATEAKPLLTSSEEQEVQVAFHLDKIPAKLEDKILLLNPMEIHYIESIDSQCWSWASGS